MKIVAIALVAAATATSALAQDYHYVSGYTRSNGTYVAPHYQTNPNGTTADNWSTRGNVNPFTGQPGTRAPTPTYGYQAPQPYATPNPYANQNPYAPRQCTGYGC